MFKLSINNKVNSSAYIVESSSHLWNLHLALINFRSLKYMRTHGLIACNDDYNDKFETCIQAKITKKPFPKAERNTDLLDFMHSDICEFNGVLTRGGKRYFITFIDDCSRYTYVYQFANKDEAFDCFKHYKSEVENQKGKKIKCLRSDRGGEYFSNEYDSFCEEHGIIHRKELHLTHHNKMICHKEKIGHSLKCLIL